jgi:hypothetical protein
MTERQTSCNHRPFNVLMNILLFQWSIKQITISSGDGRYRQNEDYRLKLQKISHFHNHFFIFVLPWWPRNQWDVQINHERQTNDQTIRTADCTKRYQFPQMFIIWISNHSNRLCLTRGCSAMRCWFIIIQHLFSCWSSSFVIFRFVDS